MIKNDTLSYTTEEYDRFRDTLTQDEIKLFKNKYDYISDSD